MKKVIFVCTGNTCRSPMAMAVCKKKLEEQGITGWQVDSAGLAASECNISENSNEALRKIGINISGFLSKSLTLDMAFEADLIVVMTLIHKGALLSAGIAEEKVIVLGNGIPDPFGGDAKVYENCLNEIIKGIDILLNEGVLN